MEYNIVDDTLNIAMQVVNGMWQGVVFGIMGYVFIEILIAPDGIFSFYRPLIQKMIFGSKYQRLNDITKKVDHVLTQCPKCFSGQLTFWLYLFNFYGFFGWATSVCVAILFAKLLSEKI